MSTNNTEQKWHNLPVEGAFQSLDSSPRGLTEGEAKRRLAEFGPNELAAEKRFKILDLILDQVKDAFVIMLIVAAVLCVVVGEAMDAILIGVIVLLCVIIGFIQEYRAERALEAMRKMIAPTARVIRDGEQMVIPASEVVPGDIIAIEEGDRIPADGRLLKVASMRTEEAPLTGESTPVDKSLDVLEPQVAVADRTNMVFMGTHAVLGRGEAIVTATGMKTEFGRIAGVVQAMETKQTPLKAKLSAFARKLGWIVIAAVIVIFVVELIRSGWGLHSVVDSLIVGITLAVSAVPEALPALVTVTLAIGARNLARQNARVRKLASAETLGATTFICADKTGTLTRGEMTVRRLYVNQKVVNVTGVGYSAKGEFVSSTAVAPQADTSLTLLLRAGALCNNALYDYQGEKIIGDPTEAALIVAAAKAGMRREELEKQYPRLWEIPFSSERKRMTTIHSAPEGKKIAYMKGAPEVLLELCTTVLEDDTRKELTDQKRNEILKINEQMAQDALRVLGVAYRELPETMEDFAEEKVEKDVTFIGLEGMIDPPREEAMRAIATCKRAGIKNVMITGDHKLTASAIARELGMMSEKDIALTGAELNELSDEEYTRIVEDVVVYARVSPADKLKIVTALKDKGHIVAMTGDGVNDAPALKKADIGVAMGITGTDVTKEASDMVLADDNYATLVRAVEGGRATYDNIRKYIRFLIACNFDELVLIGVWTLATGLLPLLPVQILWINLVTDGPPAIALSVDPPEKGGMEKKPRDPKAGIFHGMLAFILISSLCQAVGSSICFAYGYYIVGSYETAITMTFMQAVLFELFVVWNCRSETHSVWRQGRTLLRNKFFFFGTLGCIALSVALPYIPVLGPALDIVRLTGLQWAITLGVASMGLWLVIPELWMGKKILRWQ